VQRVREATKEIVSIARKDPVLGAEGAILFLERVSPALEHVDSSSGAIGSAVNRAIEALVPIIAGAEVSEEEREAWLEQLWEAYQEDQIPYIELLGMYWGELCASSEIASRWADWLMETTRRALAPDRAPGGYFSGSVNCLSALLAAERYEELFDLIRSAGRPWWYYQYFGVRALAAMDRVDEAIAFAEQCRGGLSLADPLISQTCESILLEAGRPEDAFREYAFEANRASTYLTWFRNVARRYPDIPPEEILDRLVESEPDKKGKWFAAAKSAGLYQKALDLARQSECDPKTLTRAAREFAGKEPSFALESGMLAIYWLLVGYGYEITVADVHEAVEATLAAATEAGESERARSGIQKMLGEHPDALPEILRIVESSLSGAGGRSF
jgi:hypothetical protein